MSMPAALCHALQSAAGCLLIGYGLSKDLLALGLDHPKSPQRDLIKYKKFQSKRSGQARKLQYVTEKFLGRSIQADKHSAR